MSYNVKTAYTTPESKHQLANYYVNQCQLPKRRIVDLIAFKFNISQFHARELLKIWTARYRV